MNMNTSESCILQSHSLIPNPSLLLFTCSPPPLILTAFLLFSRPLSLSLSLSPLLHTVTLPPTHTPTHKHTLPAEETRCFLKAALIADTAPPSHACFFFFFLLSILFTCMPRDTSESSSCVRSCLTLLYCSAGRSACHICEEDSS